MTERSRDDFMLVTAVSRADPSARTEPVADPDKGSSGSDERYRFGDEIARGGMGRVVNATDTRLGRDVAVKEVLAGGDLARRFEREVRITARLEHPSIVPLYDAGVTDRGRPFYVMRKVSGRPLERLIADAKTAGDRLLLLPNVLTVAQAVAHAHHRGVIHRDIKPANILVGELGETVLIDWGLAKEIDERDEPGDAEPEPGTSLETGYGAVLGTPGYMAPEQLRGEPPDPRTDVYALGSTLYRLVSGKQPANDMPAWQVGLEANADLVAIIAKAWAPVAADRYADGAAFAEDLNRLLAGRLVGAHSYTAGERLRRWLRRHRAIVSVIAVSVAVLVVAGVFGLRRVISEGDRAREAEAAAVRALGAETARADEATLAKASAEMVRNPTVAVATLRDLPMTSPRWRDARGIMIEARMRGVAHSFAILDHGNAEIGPDLRSLLIAGNKGAVTLLDLETGAQRELVAIGGRVRTAWGNAGAAAWIAPATGGLFSIEVKTGARSAPILADAITVIAADPAARTVAFVTAGKRGGLLGPAGVRWILDGASQLAISADGNWVAFASVDELAIVTLDGTDQLRHKARLEPGSLTAGVDRFAIRTGDRSILEVMAAAAAPRALTTTWDVGDLVYSRDHLFGYTRAMMLRSLDDSDLSLGPTTLTRRIWHDYTLVYTGQLRVLTALGSYPLMAPVPSSTGILLVGRRDTPYVVVLRSGEVIVWNMSHVLPVPLLESRTAGRFIDRRNVLVFDDALRPTWLALDTGEQVPIALRPTFIEGVDLVSQRILLGILQDSRRVSYLVVKRGEPTGFEVGALGDRAVFAGGRVVLATAAGEIRLVEDRPPRTLHQLDGPTTGLSANARYVLAASERTMVRIELTTGHVDPIPLLSGHAVLGPADEVFLEAAGVISRWTRAGTVPLATLSGTADQMLVGPGKVYAVTQQNEVFAIDVTARTTRRLAGRSRQPPALIDSRFIVIDNTFVIDVERDVIFSIADLGTVTSIAPDGSALMMLAAGQVGLLGLGRAETPEELRAEIERLTNFRVEPGLLVGDRTVR